MRTAQQKSIIRAAKIKLYTITLLMFAISSGYSQTNLLRNGDFEEGTIGWTVWGASLSTSVEAHSGILSVLVSNRNNSWGAVVQDITSKLVNGGKYTLSAWVKILYPSINYRATIVLNIDGVNSYKFCSWTANPISGLYVFYNDSLTISWTGNLKSANLYFEAEKAGTAFSDYLIDDVQLMGPNADTSSVKIGKGLKDIKSTMLIGGVVTDGSINYFTNSKAKSQVLTDCNAATVQCYPGGRWDESLRNTFHLDNFNFEVAEMKRHKMNVTAHTLLAWDQYFPVWYRNNDFPADTLEYLMKTWIEDIIKYKGNDSLVDIWNIVNESISWDGKGGYWPESNPDHLNACKLQKIGYETDLSGLTGNMFVNPKHPVYIRRSFEYARKFTSKKLELRESGFEFPGDGKYAAFYQLAVHLKKVGAPVDVIAFQTHLDLQNIYDWDAYTNNIKRYKRLGYDVYIPEVDIGDVDKSWSDDKANLQKMMYYRLVSAAIKGGASQFQTWGFNDNYSFRIGQNPLPYTTAFEPKPAYYGIKEALTDMSHILFWEMENTQNNLMPDVMSYNNYGSIHNSGTPVFVNGFKSKALQFDGIDDFISTGNLSDSISGNFSFSCFIKTSTTKPGIIADIAKTEISGLKIGINTKGNIYLNGSEAGLNSDLVSNKPVNDGTWHFIALRRDNNIYSLYIDSANTVLNGEGSIQNFVKLVIGAKNDGTSAFGGIIDEVKLYSTTIEEASYTRNIVPYCPLKLSVSIEGLIMKLTWINQSNNSDGFVIERKTNDSIWKEHAFVGVNILTLADKVELYNTQYTYRVRAFNKFGNSDPSNSISVVSPVDTAYGIPENVVGYKDLNCFIYPNPVEGDFTLISPPNSSMKIFDISGRVMMEKNNLFGKEILNIKHLPDGIYILKTYASEKTNAIKIIKQ
jgi:GH35 family endo-1,4-beta-xylanase